MDNHTLSPPRQVQLTGSCVLLLWRSLMVKVVIWLRLRVRVWGHALQRGNVLPCWPRRRETTWRAHIEAIDNRYVVVWLLYGIHFPPTNIFACDDPRLVLKGNAVVGALGYDVGVSFASCVQEVELLAPTAVALRLGAVVAGGFRLVALEMALSAGQTAGARALRLAVRGRIALSFLGRHGPTARRWFAWWSHGSCHAVPWR
jgi:hypothetical protein